MPQSIVQPLRRWDPDRIGPYAIIGKLGAGAMGQVFLARSAAGRLVAVKTIRIELAEEPGFRVRFAREVAAASRVSGVFTAAVIEADPNADLPWIATAYVPAPTLSTLVQAAGPLPVPAVRWLAAGCAEALQSIHAAGLLHRDVKPSNVLVAPDGPRVIDFGVARAAERVQLTTTHGASGTPAYMAPEQARDATLTSPASDIFSLGATLVYAATGHPPYRGETVMDILVRLATEPPDLAGVPGELVGLVRACLERVPRNRPTGAAILSGLGPFAHPGGPGHEYLPASVMAVIADYQRTPLLPAGRSGGTGRSGGGSNGSGSGTNGSGGFGGRESGSRESGSLGSGDRDSGRRGSHGEGSDGGESAGGGFPGCETAGSRVYTPNGATSGSPTSLPGFQSLASYDAGPGQETRPRQHHGAADPGTGTHRGSARHRFPLWRRRYPLWARAAAAVVLLAAGTGLGLLLHGSGGQSAGSVGPVLTPPAACAAQQQAGGAPALCISQPWGDGDTVYVLHGTGFSPGQPVTISLAGVAVSPVRPVADQDGMFNYAVDQGHYFFHGPLPTGRYRVVASAPGRPSVSASFQVYPAGHVPPLPSPPAAPPA
jgi:serine/threonine protein kinase